MLKINFKNIWFYVGALAAVLGVVLIIVGPAMSGFADRSFVPGIIVVLVFAVLAEIASMVFDFRFMPLLPAILFAVALGMIAYYGAPVIADHYNNLNWVNGDYTAVVVYCVLGGLCAIFAGAACFDSSKNK